jgi:F-type H+-transporting ATPase subunit gamma
MADIKDLKKRIKGVSNTQKITKAMKTMSMIRLQKAEAKAVASKPFAAAVREMVADVSEGRYFKNNGSKDVLYVVFSSDRGLCGGYNDYLFKAATIAIEKHKAAGSKVKVLAIGTKAVVYFAKRGYEIYAKYSHLPAEPTLSLSNLIVSDCKKLFLEGKIGEVVIIYNHFLSKLRYDIKFQKLLPLHAGAHKIDKLLPNFIYEPSKNVLLDSIVEMYLESTLFQSFLEASASEYSARFAAMSKATDNADEMISNLTLLLNKTRQAMITTEILEIVSGAEALSN